MLQFFILLLTCWLLGQNATLGSLFRRCALVHLLYLVLLGLWQISQFEMGLQPQSADWLGNAAYCLCAYALVMSALVTTRLLRLYCHPLFGSRKH
ncbi:MAG TPA: hypothetical protein DCS87_01720 [Rheinheimera sp.]|nr:hypothetical protein [Rheinheimera sp.]